MDIEQPLLTSEIITQASRQVANIMPLTIGGEEYYIIAMHPRTHYLLKVMFARAGYKHARWVKRYNRRQRSRGEPEYKEIISEEGTF